MSLAAWVCFDTYDVPFASTLLMSEGWTTPGKVCWQVRTDRRMGFSTTAAMPDYPNVISSGAIGDRVGRWTHLACVYDGKASQVRFHVDGRTVDVIDCRLGAPMEIGRASIGNWDPQDIPYRPGSQFLWPHGRNGNLRPALDPRRGAADVRSWKTKQTQRNMTRGTDCRKGGFFKGPRKRHGRRVAGGRRIAQRPIRPAGRTNIAGQVFLAQ